MILVSPPFSTNWGCLLADSADPPEVTRPVAGRPSMFVLRSMRKHPEIFGDVGKSYRTGEVSYYTRRTSQSSKLLRVPFADYSCPGGRNWVRSSPAPKDDSTLPVLALELSPWAMPLTLWGTWRRPSDVAPPSLFVDRSYVPVCAALLAAYGALRSPT